MYTQISVTLQHMPKVNKRSQEINLIRIESVERINGGKANFKFSPLLGMITDQLGEGGRKYLK